MIQKPQTTEPLARLPGGGGPQTKSTSITWELVRAATLQDTPGVLSPQEAPGIREALWERLVHTQVRRLECDLLPKGLRWSGNLKLKLVSDGCQAVSMGRLTLVL